MLLLPLRSLAALSRKPLYEADSKLLITKDNSAKLTGFDNQIGEIDVLTQNSDPLATEAEILRSTPILQKAIDELQLKDEEGELLDPKIISENLQVKPIIGTDILQITYKDLEPELVAEVVNKIIDIYIANDIATNRTAAVAARKFIAEQLPKVEATVRKAEADLRSFKEENKLASLARRISKNIGNN